MASHSVPYITIGNSKNTAGKQNAEVSSTSDSFNIGTSTIRNGIGPGTTPDGTIYSKRQNENDTQYKDRITYKYNVSDSLGQGTSSLSDIMDKLDKSLNLNNGKDTIEKSYQQMTEKYNRFKIANQNQPLTKGFPHVFFVRPSCNLLDSRGILRTELVNIETFNYVWHSCPHVIKELVSGSKQHDFMLSLSNAVNNFSLSDEYINYDNYGKTYTGYKIAYGKNNIESKTASEFSVTFQDDRNLRIYQTHKLWSEYISAVYRGEITPKDSNIINKILDYVGACYYFLTAEDNETIIFWCKYYGIFPTNAPVSQYSWGAGNTIVNPQIEINFRYSFKEHLNPYNLVEFNANSGVHKLASPIKYIPTFDKELGHVGRTWVGVPFVDLVRDNETNEYVYKLRFRPE